VREIPAPRLAKPAIVRTIARAMSVIFSKICANPAKGAIVNAVPQYMLHTVCGKITFHKTLVGLRLQ